MNTLDHHLTNGLERETCALAWHSVPATVDTPINPTQALESVSVSRHWRQPLAVRPSQPLRALESRPGELQTESKLRTFKNRRIFARQIGWDSWDKLSEL